MSLVFLFSFSIQETLSMQVNCTTKMNSRSNCFLGQKHYQIWTIIKLPKITIQKMRFKIFLQNLSSAYHVLTSMINHSIFSSVELNTQLGSLITFWLSFFRLSVCLSVYDRFTFLNSLQKSSGQFQLYFPKISIGLREFKLKKMKSHVFFKNRL